MGAECSGETISTSCSARSRDYSTTSPPLFNTALPMNSVYLCTSFISTRHHPITLVSPTASASSRGRLRSVRQQFPLRAATNETQIWSALFLYAAPAAWNTLPPSLQQLTNTDSFSLTRCTSRLEHSTAITATTH